MTLAFLLISTARPAGHSALLAAHFIDVGFVEQNLEVVGHYAGWIILYRGGDGGREPARASTSSLGWASACSRTSGKAVFDHLLGARCDLLRHPSRRRADLAPQRRRGHHPRCHRLDAFGDCCAPSSPLVGAVVLMFVTSPLAGTWR